MSSEAERLLETGQFDDAIVTASNELSEIRTSGNEERIAEVANVLVTAYIAIDRIADGKRITRDLLSQFKMIGNKVGQAYIMVLQAELFNAERNVDAALGLILDIERLAREAGTSSKLLEKQLLATRINLYIEKERCEDAMSAAKDLRALAQRHVDKKLEASAWQHIAMVHHLQIDQGKSIPAEMVQAAEKAVAIYREIDNRRGEATALTSVSQGQLKDRKVSQGVQTVTDSLAVWKEIGDTKGMVSALEVAIQAFSMQNKPMAGLELANQHLDSIRDTGNRRGEADILEMLAHTHSMLGEPYGAISNGEAALAIYAVLEDKMGQAGMCLVLAEMQRMKGDMSEASRMAERALNLYKLAGSKWGEEGASATLSALYVQRGMPEKAPSRIDLQHTLRELVKSIENRSVEQLNAAEAKLNTMVNLIGDDDIQSTLGPLLQKDPGNLEFLKAQGWKFRNEEERTAVTMKQYPHKGFYLQTIINGMGFGPQFRSVYPYKVGTPGKDLTALGVAHLPETECWQMNMGYRPGYLDASLQVQTALSFP